MSNTSQGPGWWQASDGKWYSPEQHPNYQPATPAQTPPAPPPQVASAPLGAGWWQASDGRWYAPELQRNYPQPPGPLAAGFASSSTPKTSQTGAVRSGPSAEERIPTWAIIGAGVVLGLGSLLPWATATTVLGNFSKNGTSGDGVLTLICAGLVVVLGIVMLRQYLAVGWIVGGAIVSAVALGIAVYDAIDLPVGNQYASVSVGFGLWLCIIAALVATGVSIYILAIRRRITLKAKARQW